MILICVADFIVTDSHDCLNCITPAKADGFCNLLVSSVQLEFSNASLGIA